MNNESKYLIAYFLYLKFDKYRRTIVILYDQDLQLDFLFNAIDLRDTEQLKNT